jgi:hypothetical protein
MAAAGIQYKEENISLCIPRVHANIPRDVVQETFDALDFGVIDRIDMVHSKSVDKFKKVFIHYKSWNLDNEDVMKNYIELCEGNSIKITYDEPWFWNVVKSSIAKPDFDGFQKVQKTTPKKKVAIEVIVSKEPEEKPTTTVVLSKDTKPSFKDIAKTTITNKNTTEETTKTEVSHKKSPVKLSKALQEMIKKDKQNTILIEELMKTVEALTNKVDELEKRISVSNVEPQTPEYRPETPPFRPVSQECPN